MLRNLLMLVIICSAFRANSQELSNFIGTWSYKQVDTLDAKQKGYPESWFKVSSQMMRTMQLTINDNKSYTASLSGDIIETGIYTFKDNQLFLNNGMVISANDKDEIYCKSPDKLSVFMTKGSELKEKTYRYLLQASYEPKEYNSENLINLWEIKEARSFDNQKPNDKDELTATVISYKFDLDKSTSLFIMGNEVPVDYIYKIDANTLNIYSSSKVDTYTIIELDKDHMILRDDVKKMFYYLEVKKENNIKEDHTGSALQHKYEVVDYQIQSLLGSWEVVDMKVSKLEKNPEAAKQLFMSMTLHFKTDDVLIFEMMGIKKNNKWSKGKSPGDLLMEIGKGEPSLYKVNKLDQNQLIITLNKNGTVLMLRKRS